MEDCLKKITISFKRVNILGLELDRLENIVSNIKGIDKEEHVPYDNDGNLTLEKLSMDLKFRSKLQNPLEG